jgi:hypothetical protein
MPFIKMWCLFLILPVQSTYFEQVLDSTMTLGWDIDMATSEITMTLKVLSI